MHTTLRPHSMTSRLLENGQARVDEMLRKGYAPSHFSHNLELILIGDTRSSNSPSMQTKIANTRERSACLRTLEPLILIWWAAAFPMRQWSGGRKISSSTFESLIQHVPRHAAHTRALLALVGDDLGRLSQKYLFCETLHNFLNALPQDHVTEDNIIPTDIPDMCLELGSNCDSESTINCSAAALLQEGRYISLSGARYDCLPKFPDLLRNGIEKSRRYQEEGTKAALISTVLEVFVPTDPSTDDAFAIVPIGTTEIWHILQVLGIVG